MYTHSKYHPTYPAQSQSQESACSQCKKHTYGIRQQQQESSELANRQMPTSSSEDQVSIPIGKQIVQHNYEFEQALKLLQFQVDTLKKQNEAKEKIIHELKYQFKHSAKQELLKTQMERQAFQINRLRKDLACSPRNNFQAAGKLFTANSSNMQKKNRKMQYQSLNPTSNFISLKHNNYSSPNHSSQIPFDNQLRTSYNSQQKYDLKIAVLQKQIRQYQLQMMKMKQILNSIEQENVWQQKFIHSFIKMADQLSLNYGNKLKLKKCGEDLKKKTKLSWQYMKQLISFFIDGKSQIDPFQEQ